MNGDKSFIEAQFLFLKSVKKAIRNVKLILGRP